MHFMLMTSKCRKRKIFVDKVVQTCSLCVVGRFKYSVFFRSAERTENIFEHWGQECYIRLSCPNRVTISYTEGISSRALYRNRLMEEMTLCTISSKFAS